MSGISSGLSKELLVWVTKNRSSFILVILIAGNVYQYVGAGEKEAQFSLERKEWKSQVQKLTDDAIDFERRRSEKLEFLIQSLPKVNQSNVNSNGDANTQKTHN